MTGSFFCIGFASNLRRSMFFLGAGLVVTLCLSLPAVGQNTPIGPPVSPSVSSTGSVKAKAIAEFLNAPVFVPAIDYEKIEKIPKCKDEVDRKIKYHNCRQSAQIYTAGLEKAKANNSPLMVIFGFNKCPYCTVLERTIFNPENPVRTVHVARYFSKTELQRFMSAKSPLSIPYIRIHARSEHGLKLADNLGVTDMAKAAGWHRVWSPFVVFVNPQTGDMTSESEWDAKDIYCDWPANIAVSLEKLDMVKDGPPLHVRKRCSKS